MKLIKRTDLFDKGKAIKKFLIMATHWFIMATSPGLYKHAQGKSMVVFSLRFNCQKNKKNMGSTFTIAQFTISL